MPPVRRALLAVLAVLAACGAPSGAPDAPVPRLDAGSADAPVDAPGADAVVTPSACTPACGAGDVCVAGTCEAAIANPCGPATGYAPNSPWPTITGCETNQRRTFAIGPAVTPVVAWRWNPTVGINQAMIWGPVIDGTGALYAVSEYDVTRLAPDGHEVWRRRIVANTDQVAGAGPAVLLADGDVLVCVASQPEIQKRRAATGELVWTTTGVYCGGNGSLIDDSGITVPAVAPDGTISNAGLTMSPVTGALGPVPPRGCVGTPVIDGAGVAYCMSEGQLIALRPDGTQAWSSNLDGFHRMFGHVMLTSYQGNPVVTVPVQNGVVTPNQWIALYPTAGPGTTANDPSVPHLSGFTFFGPAAVAPDRDLVFLNRGSGATAGVERWGQDQIGAPTPVARWISATPRGGARSPHPAPVIDGNGDIYYGSYDGYLIALAASGAERWRVRIGQADGVGNLGTPAIAADGTIYVVGHGTSGASSYLYALRAP